MMRLFASLSKVEEQDDGSLKVFGIASSGARDDAGEIITPEAMKAAIPGYLAYGAVREMHQPSAAGTALECSVDSDGMTNLVAHIVDPLAVTKVKTGVYKGLSIGGKVLKRDPKDPTTITALKLVEISLVDRPCNPEASINMWKADMADPLEQTMSATEYTPPAEDVRARAAEMAKAAGEPEKNASNYMFDAMKALRAEYVPMETEKVAEAASAVAVDADSAPEPVVTKADPAADLLKAVADLQATLHPAEAAPTAAPHATPGLADFSKGLEQLVAKPDVLGKGLYGVSRMFEIVASIVSMQNCSAWEEQSEGDTTSTAPKDLAALVNQAGQIALNMAKEELAEAMMDMKNDMPEVDIEPDFALAAAAMDLVKADTALMEKAGKRNSAKDAAAIQASHDHMVGLGAKCDKANVEKGAGADDLAKVTAEYEDLKKVVADVAPQIAALREEVAILKAQPLPPKTAGSHIAVVAGVSTLGEEDAVTYEAIGAARTFEDIQATMSTRLLQKIMLKEELALLGGNTSLQLGTPVAPTLGSVTPTPAATLPAATYSVYVVALTLEGVKNSSLAGGVATTKTITGQDGKTFNLNGGSSNKSANATQAITLGNALIMSVTPILGALGYAWYVGTAGNEVLQAITQINSLLITAPLTTGTQNASAVTADCSTNSLAFDGLLTWAFKAGGYVNTLATGTAGTGTVLTASGKGTVNEIDAMLEGMWDSYQVSPSVLYVNSRQLRDISTKALSGGTAPLLSIRQDINDASGYTMTAGGNIGWYFNPFTMDGGQRIPIRLHPNLPAGTIIGWATDLPAQYMSNNVPNVAEVKTRTDYYAIDWPITTRQRQRGVYTEEVLAVYAPFAMGIISNIAAG